MWSAVPHLHSYGRQSAAWTETDWNAGKWCDRITTKDLVPKYRMGDTQREPGTALDSGDRVLREWQNVVVRCQTSRSVFMAQVTGYDCEQDGAYLSPSPCLPIEIAARGHRPESIYGGR